MNFADFLAHYGLRPRSEPQPDGKWHRCPTETHPRKRNGSYKWAADGLVGFAQDFASMTEPVIWRPDENDFRAAPKFDPSLLAKRTAEARAAQVSATQAARDYYLNRCSPLIGRHPYLESHGLGMAGCGGLKVDSRGWLVVPAYRDRNLMTVQRISPAGEKLFWPGAPVKGASYTIDRRTASLTVVCEGLATGLAIFTAAPLTRVIVAFNAGNLEHVENVPPGMLTVAADNDWETGGRSGSNPGVLAAQRAASVLQAGIAVPEGMRGSDFCDWRNEAIDRRLARKLPNQREAEIVRAVDAALAAQILQSAVYRAP